MRLEFLLPLLFVLATALAWAPVRGAVPPGWRRIGVGTKADHQQNFIVGNFTDAPGVEMITSYSHGDIGIFHQYFVFFRDLRTIENYTRCLRGHDY